MSIIDRRTLIAIFGKAPTDEELQAIINAEYSPKPLALACQTELSARNQSLEYKLLSIVEHCLTLGTMTYPNWAAYQSALRLELQTMCDFLNKKIRESRGTDGT